jgi:hypothetical protein
MLPSHAHGDINGSYKQLLQSFPLAVALRAGSKQIRQCPPSSSLSSNSCLWATGAKPWFLETGWAGCSLFHFRPPHAFLPIPCSERGKWRGLAAAGTCRQKHIQTHIYTYGHSNTHAYFHKCPHTCTHTYMHTQAWPGPCIYGNLGREIARCTVILQCIYTVLTNPYTYIHMCVFTHTTTQARTHAHMHARTSTHAHMHARTHARTRTCSGKCTQYRHTLHTQTQYRHTLHTQT